MTRPYRKTIKCVHCGGQTPNEEPINQWIRNEPELDSVRAGLFMLNSDLWVHHYKTDRGRDFQCIMLVELKTFGAELDKYQRDTLLIVNQILRNRRQTPTSTPISQAGTAPLKVNSHIAQRRVVLKAFGVHVLRLSADTPDNSEWMQWDKARFGQGGFIDREQLVKLLRFELDPDTLGPLDLRRHHRLPVDQPSLFDSSHIEGLP